MNLHKCVVVPYTLPQSVNGTLIKRTYEGFLFQDRHPKCSLKLCHYWKRERKANPKGVHLRKQAKNGRGVVWCKWRNAPREVLQVYAIQRVAKGTKAKATVIRKFENVPISLCGATGTTGEKMGAVAQARDAGSIGI